MDQIEKLHENVRAAIRGLDAEWKVYDHRELATEIRTPAEFASALGYPVERIAKTLFLCSPDRQAYAAAVCSVSRRLDFKSAVGAIRVSRVEVASAEDLAVKTGYPRNGVSPLGLADGISVVVDSLVLNYPSILIGGGAAAVEIEIAPADLVRISGAAVASITREG
jgi:Cys-tRNA(Pro)/Cys-tRNA(Cys) deacylase